jgi:sugar O-acyltransferase (sialic acid O-acetyltransferase NeuD family)
VIEAEGKFIIEGIVDVKEKIGHKTLGYSVIASDENLPELCRKNYCFLITIGHMGERSKRDNLMAILKKNNAKIATIISPFAYISRHAKIAQGTIIMHHALVNANAVIGENCIINSKALIEHDCRIGDNCHISTGAIVNGATSIADGVFFGSGAVAKQSISIAENSFIKANSVVK